MHAHASLNRMYRLVWSALHQTWVVASELTRGRGKGNATPLLSAALLAGLAATSGGAGAAPQGGQLVSGSGTISANGATTTITQASEKLSINWQSFNVAKAETVNFVQPSASALAVNRILDTQGSQILGKINANGQVWLINPNGVLFGKDAQINVGGLLASTLNPDDASIGSARSNFSGSSTAGVVNLGSINAAQGGYVALLGHSVSNPGSISAPGGTVAMGAGSAISLNFAGNKLLGLEVSSNQINALAENGGLIQADGGQVLLSAGARESLLASVVNNTGILQARTVQEQDGKIILLGGMAAGSTHVAGTLDASASNGGNGGFIETSAFTVKVDDSASITTASAQGTQGQWLIDPFDFYVAASGGNITGAALGKALGSNNVTIQTVETGNPSVTGATASGTYSGTNGDIFVNDAVSWTSNKTLTLNAYRDININSAITGNSGGLTLTAGGAITSTAAGTLTSTGAAGADAGNISLTASGNVNLLGAITANGGNATSVGRKAGNVAITAQTGITTAAITASGSAGATGNNGGGAAGAISLTNSTSGNIITGTLTSRTGAATGTGAGGTAGSISVTNNARGGNVTTGALTTQGGTKGAGGNITVSAAGTLITNGKSITASGGAGSTSAGANAGNITLSGGTVTLGESVLTASGGNGNGTSFAGGNGGAIRVTSTQGGMTGTRGTLGAIRANGGTASGDAAAGGAAGKVTLTNTADSTGAIELTSQLEAKTGVSVGTTAALDAGSITVNNDARTATATTLGQIYTDGGASGNGHGGDVNITTTGTLSVITISAIGGGVNAGSTLAGRSGGKVTINTGAAITKLESIFAHGSAGVGTNQAGGAGGVVSITTVGGIEGFPTRLRSNGGAGSTTDGAGGAAGTITVINNSAGAITLGALEAKAGAAGGTGAGGAAGSISVTNNASGGKVTTGALTTAGNVTLSAGGAVTQSGAITATGLALNGTGGAYTLDHADNAVTTLAANTRSVNYRQSGALVVGTVSDVSGVTTTGTTQIETTGAAANLTLNNAVTSRATGDAIILKAGSDNAAGESTGGQLVNTVGTGGIVASDASGRYLVYSGNPDSTTEGVTGYAKRYNANKTFVPSSTTASTFMYRIAPTLTVTANAGSKVYNGAAPTLTFGTAGLIDGDTVSTALTGALTRAGGKNVLGGDAVTIGTLAAQMGYGITYTGANYSITPKAITLSGITAANKTYDGTTAATVSTKAAVFSNKLTGDDLTVSSSGSFATKTAETGKTVTLVNTLGGADLANYSITEQTTATATIDKKAITLSGITASDKTYDGTTAATVSTTTAVFSNKLTGDDLTVSSSGSFATKTAETGKTVTLVNTLGGADLNNYSITQQTSTRATIDKAALVYTASKASSNTGNTPTGLDGVVSGFVNNETQSSATTGTLVWTTPANSASGAGSYAINGSGLSADNYSFSQAVENSTALTLIQSVSIVPVINSPSLSTGTGFGKSAPLSQTSAPLSVPDNINTLSATSAGSVQSNGPTVTKSFGSSGLLYTQGSGVKLPSDFFNVTPADPAKNP